MLHLTVAGMLQMNGFLWVYLHNAILYWILDLGQHIVAIAVDNLNKFVDLATRVRHVLPLSLLRAFLLIVPCQRLCKDSYQRTIA